MDRQVQQKSALLPATRRRFLGVFALSTGPAYLAACAPGAVVCDTTSWTITPKAAGTFFDCHQMSVLSDAAELIVAHGDAPTVHATGAMSYIDGMIDDWAGPSMKGRLARLAGYLDDFANTTIGQPYTQLPIDARTQLLADFDEQSFADRESETGEAYTDFKSLLLKVYFTSEENNREYVRIPGEYLGDLSQEEYIALLRARAENFEG